MKSSSALLVILLLTSSISLSFGQQSDIINKTLTFDDQTLPSDNYIDCSITANNSVLKHSFLYQSLIIGENLYSERSILDNTFARLTSSKISNCVFNNESTISSISSSFNLTVIQDSKIWLSSQSELRNSLITNGTVAAEEPILVQNSFNNSYFISFGGYVLNSLFERTYVGLNSDDEFVDLSLEADNDIIDGYFHTSTFNNVVLSANRLNSFNNNFNDTLQVVNNSKYTNNYFENSLIDFQNSEISNNVINTLKIMTEITNCYVKKNTFVNSDFHLKSTTSYLNMYSNSYTFGDKSVFMLDSFAYADMMSFFSQLSEVQFVNSTIDINYSELFLTTVTDSASKFKNCSVSSFKTFNSFTFIENTNITGTFINSLICNKNSNFDSDNILINSKVVSYTSSECQEQLIKMEEKGKDGLEMREQRQGEFMNQFTDEQIKKYLSKKVN